MKDLNNEAFIGLFKEAYQKCFGFPLTASLSETESKHFANEIFDATGLVIGAKTIKNYSLYVIHNTEAKQENPSIATLDTLARFVLNAPYTDEVKRKDKEGHHPYWFQYKSKFAIPDQKEYPVGDMIKPQPEFHGKRIKIKFNLLIAVVLLVVAVLAIRFFFKKNSDAYFSENFHSVNEDSIRNNGWFLKDKDERWWNKRGEMDRHLTLFTLRGDNWADSANKPGIKNLLLRKISLDCFTAEIQFDNFIPKQNWQQAGILLLEDTGFSGKSIRLSLAYNDFFGGYKKPGEIIIQAINSNGNDLSKPEEIGHLTVFSIDSGKEELVYGNLRKSALKIEKNGDHFRFLFATGSMENFAFKEALNKDLQIKPKYIGIFALQGFVSDTSYIPAQIKFFSITPCEK